MLNSLPPDSSDLSTTPSSSLPQPSNSHSYAIKSLNVLLEEHPDPIEAIIIIHDGKIHDVKIPQETPQNKLENLYKDYEVLDYGDLFIFPGLIDSNVHLHADFSNDWENIEHCTTLAVSGGVTTIVDNPLMSANFDSGAEYIETLKKRIEKIRVNSKVDFGVFGLLDPKTLDYVNEIVQIGAMGVKCFLLNCIQSAVGHFERENFKDLLAELEEKRPDLLLLVHPELATEREIYLTSPCRSVPLRKRLDLSHAIKSIEFGGAANKGSYIEELCRKKQDDNEEDEEDLFGDRDCSIADFDSPTKLKSRLKQTKEKTEINDLVHFELLSYSYDVNNEQALKVMENDDGNGSDSDIEILDNTDKKDYQKASSCIGFMKCHEVKEEDEAAEEMTENIKKGRQQQLQEEESNRASPVKMSRFSRRLRPSESLPVHFEIREQKEEGEITPYLKEKQPSEAQEEIAKQQPEENQQEELNPLKVEKKFFTEDCFEESPPALNQRPVSNNTLSIGSITDISSSKIDPKDRRSTLKSLGNPFQKNSASSLFSEGKTKKTVTLDQKRTQTRKFLAFLTASESNNSSPMTSDFNKGTPETTDNTPQILTSKDSTALPACSESSQQSLDEKSPNFSPSFSARPVGSSNSSLLQRRISLKSAINIRPSITSIMSSPGSNFNKVNSLDLFKTPEELAKKEAKFNQSYRTFLANRPLSWEENAVSLVLNSLKSETKLRLMLQNLSLASSFLKIHEKKKAHEAFNKKLYGDAGASYLFFTERSVQNGETKFKVSPPFRNKENRRLLADNMRLGGIDIMSSYHFYVPNKFKEIDGGNFRRAFGGLDSMGCSLQAAWTALYGYQQKTNKRFSEDPEYQKKMVSHILKVLVRTMCGNPAQLLKISHQKGSIAKGKDADLVIWDPYKIERNATLKNNHVFMGRKLMGVVQKTYLRGALVYNKDAPNQISQDFSAQFIKPLCAN